MTGGARPSLGATGRHHATTLSPVLLLTSSDEDATAARALDAIQNRTFVDPCLLGTYPGLDGVGIRSTARASSTATSRSDRGADRLLGVNYYNPTTVKAPGRGQTRSRSRSCR